MIFMTMGMFVEARDQRAWWRNLTPLVLPLFTNNFLLHGSLHTSSAQRCPDVCCEWEVNWLLSTFLNQAARLEPDISVPWLSDGEGCGVGAGRFSTTNGLEIEHRSRCFALNVRRSQKEFRKQHGHNYVLGRAEAAARLDLWLCPRAESHRCWCEHCCQMAQSGGWKISQPFPCQCSRLFDITDDHKIGETWRKKGCSLLLVKVIRLFHLLSNGEAFWDQDVSTLEC